MKKIYWIVLFVPIVILIAMNTAKFYHRSHISRHGSDYVYKAILANNIQKTRTTTTYGKVEAGSIVDISSDSPGKIKAILVDRYSFVSKNQKIAMIDDIIEGNVISPRIDIPEIETTVEEGRLPEKTSKRPKNIELSATQRYIVSPCNGYIKEIYQEVGSTINIGFGGSGKIAIVACTDNIYISSSVSGDFAKELRAGARVDIEASEIKLSSKIQTISRVLSENGSIKFRVKINPKLIKKLYIDEDVDMIVYGKQYNVTCLPQNAVISDLSGKHSVYIIQKDGQLESKGVEIITHQNEQLCVSGINDNEMVLISGVNKVKSNMKVTYEII